MVRPPAGADGSAAARQHVLRRDDPARRGQRGVDAAPPAPREVGYRGIFSVEFKLDARDGHYKIIEVNPRPFWLIGHIARAGIDLPG